MWKNKTIFHFGQKKFHTISLGPFIQSWRTFLYKLNSDVPQEYYPLVQELIDLSYPLERALTSGDIDGIMNNYAKSLIIAKNLLPHVKDPKLRTTLSDRIEDFEGLVGKLRSGENNVHDIQGFLNKVTGTLATVATKIVGAVHNVVKGILDTIFNLINLKH